MAAASQGEWEDWLDANQGTRGCWLRVAKKGVVGVHYEEAVESGLCFGWIDGQARSLDERFYLQRFTPRGKRSGWSKSNVDRVARLIAAGRMRPGGQAEVEAAKSDGRWPA